MTKRILDILKIQFTVTQIALMVFVFLVMIRFEAHAGFAIAPCDDCDLSMTLDPTKVSTREFSAEQISIIGDKMNWGDVCDNFASEEAFGKWGQIIMKELRSNANQALLNGSSDLSAICPKYSSFSLDDRLNLWVLIVNAIAFYESSCNSSITARGPNGRLVGLLQLHSGKEDVYAPACKKGDGNTPAGTFRCGLSMLNTQLERGEPLFSRRSYWDVLRPQARSQKYKQIKTAIKSYPACK